MFTTRSYDPHFYARARREHPRFHPNHIGLIRLAHRDGLEQLAELDGELDLLAARRRAVLSRLAHYRTRLWPGDGTRHQRKICRLEDEPIAPVPVDAILLWGGDLRRVMVAVVRRHGPISLRELHGLIHRYGYEIASDRPVQRLADAAAYEVRRGRMERVDRAVYGPAGATDEDPSAVLGVPLPWSSPAAAAGTGVADSAVDPGVALDPERWSGGRWPPAAQAGGAWCDGDPDPFVRDLVAELDVTIAAAKERAAEAALLRTGPLPTQWDPAGRPRRARAEAPIDDESGEPVAVDEFDEFEELEAADDLDLPGDPAPPGHPPTDPATPSTPGTTPGALGNDSSTNRSQMAGKEDPAVGDGGGGGGGSAAE